MIEENDDDFLNSIDEHMKEDVKPICCLCNKEYEGYGNNSEPLMEGLCCNSCNILKVIPERMKGYKKL